MPDSPITDQPAFDREHVAGLISRERETYGQRHARSGHAFGTGGTNLLGGVPMTWMRMWPGGFPICFAEAHGARLTDIDGNAFIDFCLGDTGAMAGHSPAATVAAVTRRYGELGGASTMLPTEDAGWVAADLARRFGPARWSFTLTATDANRWAIRLARQLTGRPKILVFSYCYHGSVDETFIVAGPRREPLGRQRRRPGRSAADHPRGRVQRPGHARARARRRRRGHRPDGTRPDQHRHRAARARLPGGCPRSDPPLRLPAHQR